MIFVGVSQNKACKLVPALHDKRRIRHDDIDPGGRVVAEGDAEIDHQPAPGMAVEVQVHADFAGAAQRNENEILAAEPIDIEGLGHAATLRL